MKDKSRKLNLVRETIAPMDKDQLAEVNGGAESFSISYSRGQSWSISYSGYSVSVSRGESQGQSVSRP